MAVVIRMTRTGQRNRPFYRIVAADRRFSRDGRHLEILGSYDPRSKSSTVEKDAAEKWIRQGAEVTRTVRRIFAERGVSLATK